MQYAMTNGGGKVIDMTSLFRKKNLLEKSSGLNKVPTGLIAAHFNARRGLGEGLYCLRVYDHSGHPEAFMSGVIWEQSSGDPNYARREDGPQEELVRKLHDFYLDKAKDKVEDPQDVCVMRDGHMSFLAIKCQKGIIVSGWYDTDSETSTNGVHMLAFTLYALGALNQHDPVLKKAVVNYLPFADGIGYFNVNTVEKELEAYAAVL